jgi:hypothetical protein
MMSGSMTCEIAASPQVVWETITDSQHATSILTQLMEHDVISGEIPKVGSVVRETRIWKSRTTESFRTITAVTIHDGEYYSLSTNIHLSQSRAFSKKQHAARTGSWTIVQGNSNGSSVFVWTYAAIPETWQESMALFVFGKVIRKSIEYHFQQDLQDFKREAERRQQARMDCGCA